MVNELVYCHTCKNAKQTEGFHDKEGTLHPLWKCGKHKQMITDLTLVSSTCKGKDYDAGRGD